MCFCVVCTIVSTISSALPDFYFNKPSKSNGPGRLMRISEERTAPTDDIPLFSITLICDVGVRYLKIFFIRKAGIRLHWDREAW